MTEIEKHWTVEDVIAVVKERMESNAPDAILAVLKEHEGKQLTKRILPKLPGGEAEWLIRQNARMTHLENRSCQRSQGSAPGGISFLMAYSEKNVMIDVKFVLEYNKCYFAAREERNAKRMQVLKSPVLSTQMAEVMNEVLAARKALAKAEGRMAELTKYGEPFSPDDYVFQKLAGEPTRS